MRYLKKEDMQGVRVLSDDLQAVSQRVRSMVESLQMSLNTAIRTASESLNLERHEDKTILVEQDVDVILKGEGGTFRSQLLDISNNAMALSPPLDVKLGQEYKAEIQGLRGSFTIEVLSKRGLQAEKTRIRFVDEMEERGEIVRFVVGLWAERLRQEFGLVDEKTHTGPLKRAAE